MSLSNKILLAAKKPLTLASWRGQVSLGLEYMEEQAYTYSYVRFKDDEGSGSLAPPLLQTVKYDTQLYLLYVAVNPKTMRLLGGSLCFYEYPEPSSPPWPKEFVGLSKCTIYSTTGGYPFVINNMDRYYDPLTNSYIIFSEDLADWAYQNLNARETLDFTFELEWYE